MSETLPEAHSPVVASAKGSTQVGRSSSALWSNRSNLASVDGVAFIPPRTSSDLARNIR